MATQLGAGRLIGHRVLDNQGSSVGKIGEVYYDDETDVAKWVTVRTGLFGTRESFVPLQEADQVEDDIQVPYDRQTVKDAPHFDAGQHISADEERRIFEHYERARSGVPGQRGSSEEMPAGETEDGRRSASGTGAGTMEAETGTGAAAADTAEAETGMRPDAGTGTDEARAAGAAGTDMPGSAPDAAADTAESGSGTAADTAAGAEAAAGAESETGSGAEAAVMTRFEELVRVSTERAESGRVRLRKHVETEEFQETVHLTREEITVEREPVEGSGHGDTRMEADDQEIVLYEEHATISKESVPVERVRVRKHEVTERQPVRGERRKERVELEDEDFQEPPR
ncbi:PRC and DUF2382 domain-containing protein [Streptomonospora salina]|uniref:Uncharacterized protein (TIGR02271 family) n=1 Tax=Streptomonospora salina TaxID=104205 RepID=A0A841EEH7_9ACTN|nr:PRC and DUF2382 domain-containing protein [Streptomonospora salina]MBB5997831.1 uncharacterized protein (TIGR02271 family) [Streptomonospora salina]